MKEVVAKERKNDFVSSFLFVTPSSFLWPLSSRGIPTVVTDVIYLVATEVIGHDGNVFIRKTEGAQTASCPAVHGSKCCSMCSKCVSNPTRRPGGYFGRLGLSNWTVSEFDFKLELQPLETF